eukprot:761900-Hanusia_phi.AAC.7
MHTSLSPLESPPLIFLLLCFPFSPPPGSRLELRRPLGRYEVESAQRVLRHFSEQEGGSGSKAEEPGGGREALPQPFLEERSDGCAAINEGEGGGGQKGAKGSE